MPWVVKTEKESAAAADEEKPKQEKSEGKGGKAKGGDKGGKNGKGDREGDKGGKKGKDKGDSKGSKGDDWGGRKGDDWGYGGKGDRGGYDSRGYDRQEKGKKGDGKKGGYKGKDEGKDNFRSKGGDGEKGGKGKGKYDDDRKGDSKGGKKGDGKGKGRPRNDSEENIRAERPLRSEDVRRQATAHTGKHCQVRKHSSMGCAVVTLDSIELRQAIKMVFCATPGAAPTKYDIGGHQATLRPHAEKESNADIPTDIFVGWGRQTEKNDPLSDNVIADWFDEKHIEFVTTGRLTPQGLGDSEAKRLLAQQTAQKQAQWAAGGVLPGMPAGARAPGAPIPGGPVPPGVNPAAANPYALQQQQQQYMAAMQAQYMRAYQQQQAAYYAAAQQAQQQQQAAYMAHLKGQQEAQAAARNRKAGYKAAYRVPTDDEVQATLMKLAGKKTADAAPAEFVPGQEFVPAGGAPAAEAAPATDAAPAAPAADAA